MESDHMTYITAGNSFIYLLVKLGLTNIES